MDEKLDIEALGPLRVRVNGQLVEDLTAQKAGALLVYLAFSGRGHTRESLSELLWADRSQERALGSLRMALSALRQHLAPFISASRQTIALVPDSYRLDAHQLMAAVAEARQANSQLCANGVRHLTEVLERYRGDFLRDFYGGSPEFEEWLYITREQLKASFCDGTLLLADYYSRRGAYAEALPIIQLGLTVDQLNEVMNRQMMLLLDHCGRRSEAVEHFRAFQSRLAAALGVEPSAETMRLYQLLQTTDSINGNSVSDNLPGVPLNPTPLVGREQLLAEIAGHLPDLDCKVITLVGPGGIGKTRLALAAASLQQHNPSCRDGVFIVPLSAYASAEQIPAAVAAALGYRALSDGRPLRQQICDFLRRKHVLIVLDNYEHLLSGADFVAELGTNPSVQIIVTSREPLNLPQERLLRVEGLAYPLQGAPAPTYEGAHLFVRAVQRLLPGYDPSEQDFAPIAQICRLVDGSPLGILLAAAWMDVLTPGEIADEIQKSVLILENRLLGMPERHSNIHAVFESTLERLSLPLRTIFLKLSVFRGGCTREAAQNVASAQLRDIQTLVAKALIFRDATGRLTIHELLRQYAEEQLSQSGLDEVAHAAHSLFYLDFLKERESGIKGERQQDALKEIDADFENVRAAWLWAAKHGKLAHLDDSLECLYWYCEMRRQPERYELLQAALAVAERQNEDVISGHVLAYCWQTPVEGRLRLRRALAIAKRCNDIRAIARCIFQRGLVAREDARDGAARRLLECAYKAHRTFDDSFCLTVIGGYWTTALIYSGRAAEAEQITESLIPLARSNGDRIYLARLVYNRASSLATRGADGAADRCHQEARELLQAMGDHLTAADIGAWGMGVSGLRAGNFVLVRKRAQELLVLAQEYQSRVNQARALCMLSAVELVDGSAAYSYELAEQASTMLGDHANATYADSFLAAAAAVLGDYRLVRDVCTRWLELAITCGERVLTSLLLIPAAAVLAHEGQFTLAAECTALAMHYPGNLGIWAEKVLSLYHLPGSLRPHLSSDLYDHAWNCGKLLNPQMIADELLRPRMQLLNS